jgi:ABC-2 type transport system permease protein
MRTTFILFRREFSAFFLSPVAYIVIALVMVLNGFSFKAAMTVLESAPSEGSLVTWTFNSRWFWLFYFFIFPLVTMRLFAEERKLGTWEALLTAPVRTSQVILAKFGAALVFYMILWAPSAANFFLFDIITGGATELPPGALYGSYLFLFLMGLFHVAIGCFASALTTNQIVAAIVCFTLCLVHFLTGMFAVYLGQGMTVEFGEFFFYFATVEHIRSFTSGLIDTRPIVYYLSFTLLFLAFTHQVLEYRRWKV